MPSDPNSYPGPKGEPDEQGLFPFERELIQAEKLEIERQSMVASGFRLQIEVAVQGAIEAGLGMWGDGHGGYLMDVVLSEIRKYIPAPDRAPDPRNKHKINPGRRLRILARDGYQCLKCGTNNDLCMDHIVPISRGGETDDDNLQTLCRTCNLQKGTATEDCRQRDGVAA